MSAANPLIMEEESFGETNQLIEYYDAYVPRQQESGINDRIYGLYKRLLKSGLNKNSNVLELGCGIGAMTYLLSRMVKIGIVEAVDISGESINFARQRIKQPNIGLIAGNILNYVPKNGRFDFITLFDIIEHVPIEDHPALFKSVSGFANEETMILINIPNPAYIEYEIKHRPDLLQVVDQPLPLGSILNNLIANGLDLVFFESYSVWVEQDYQFFIARKAKAFNEIKLSTNRNFFSKAMKKLERELIKIRFPYR